MFETELSFTLYKVSLKKQAFALLKKLFNLTSPERKALWRMTRGLTWPVELCSPINHHEKSCKGRELKVDTRRKQTLMPWPCGKLTCIGAACVCLRNDYLGKLPKQRLCPSHCNPVWVTALRSMKLRWGNWPLSWVWIAYKRMVSAKKQIKSQSFSWFELLHIGK